MKKSSRQYAQALYEVTKGLSGKKLEQVLEEFVLLLARDRKIKQADRIISDFTDYAGKLTGRQKIEITAARKISKDAVEKIEKTIGKRTEAEVKIVPEILGGIKILAEDKIFDASFKTQLLKLKNGLCR